MSHSQKKRFVNTLPLMSLFILSLALLPIRGIEVTEPGVDWSRAQAAETHSGGHGYRGGKQGHGHDSDDSHHSDHRDHVSNRSPADAVETDVLRGHGRDNRPVWAGGGIPEVELGRLNVSRAPSFVLDRALSEAQSELANNPDAEIHSPMANLAMYRETLKNSELTQVQLEAAARYLGTAADKRSTISEETVEALNIILGTGLNLTNEQVSTLSLEADAIRANIMAAHDTEDGDTENTHDH